MGLKFCSHVTVLLFEKRSKPKAPLDVELEPSRPSESWLSSPQGRTYARPDQRSAVGSLLLFTSTVHTPISLSLQSKVRSH